MSVKLSRFLQERWQSRPAVLSWLQEDLTLQHQSCPRGSAPVHAGPRQTLSAEASPSSRVLAWEG